ncbi:MAG: hypothetical protein GEU78_14130 [Actinobacteria bacterium]|nr:hypothetical protein [Actinomycetota bacterium]
MSLSHEDWTRNSAYRLVVASVLDDVPPGWFATRRTDSAIRWVSLDRQGLKLPPHGWKIHVSCASDEAHEMLAVCVGFLLDVGCPAKFPSSLSDVVRLNAGRAGLSQIGKILTVYPPDPGRFESVALGLLSRWTSERGPLISNEMRLGSSRRIFARYGAFERILRRNSAGLVEPAIRTPDGQLVVDERSSGGSAPGWAPPLPGRFAAAEQVREPVTSNPAELSDVYYFPAKPGNSVSLSIDTSTLECCVVKRGRRGVHSDVNGHDAISRLRREYDTLCHISSASSELAARAVELTDDGELAELSVEDLGGQCVALSSRADQRRALPWLAGALGALHRMGYVHRDVKLENVIRTDHGYRLVDFELAAPIGDPSPPVDGTEGYVPPEGPAATAAPSADAYALGATLFRALTGIDPSTLPSHHRVERMLGLVAVTGMSPTATRLVAELMRERPEQRLSVLDAEPRITALLGQTGADGRVAVTPRTSRQVFRQIAAGAGRAATDGLSHYEQRSPAGRYWVVPQHGGSDAAEDVDSGVAGIILALSIVRSRLSDSSTRLRIRSEWLASREPDPAVHGLFVGNSGVALALAVQSRATGRRDLAVAARARLSAAGKARDIGPDLYAGTAGVIWAACCIARVLGAAWPLEHVAELPPLLMSSAQQVGGVVCWPASRDYDPRTRPYLGAAHGAAGVAAALGVWGAATDDAASAQFSRKVLESLAAEDSFDERARLRQGPDRPGTRPWMWCHGTAGLLWCASVVERSIGGVGAVVDHCLDALEEQDLFATADPSLCHGAAGVLESLRTVPAAHRSAFVRSTIDRYAQLLAATFDRQAEPALWSTAGSTMPGPGLMTGFMGPAAEAAALVTGSDQPLLSPEGLTGLAFRRAGTR